MISRSEYIDLLCKHYQGQWNSVGADVGFYRGPVEQLPIGFHVVRHPPTAERNTWIYETVGMSTLAEEGSLELHVLAKQCADGPIAEALYAVAHYHHTGHALRLHDVVNIGRPWVPGSVCEHGLVSLPYLDGPALEFMKIDGGLTTRCLWLIPITKAERRYAIENGVEALETRFEAVGFPYADIGRESVL